MADYRDRARCRNEDPELFYPLGEGRAFAEQIAEAKEVCEACPVRAECLEDALARREPDGIWGGLTADERRALLRRQRDQRRQLPRAS